MAGNAKESGSSLRLQVSDSKHLRKAAVAEPWRAVSLGQEGTFLVFCYRASLEGSLAGHLSPATAPQWTLPLSLVFQKNEENSGAFFPALEYLDTLGQLSSWKVALKVAFSDRRATSRAP